MPRLFIAIDLPAPIRDQVALMGYGLPGATWSPSAQYHVTVRFIGDVDGAVMWDIMEALSTVHAPPFALTLAGTGHFPPRGNPKVLWVGVAGCDPLITLRRRVERAVAAVGLPPEGRRYSPHLTLARLKNTPPRRVAVFLADHAGFSSPPFEVTAFHLYSSQLTPGGAHHRIEQTFLLTDSPGASP